MNRATNFNRRSFLATSALASTALFSGIAKAKPAGKIKLGFDNFSIRSLGWKAPQLIDHAAALKVDILMMSDLDVYDNFEESYLKKIKAQAEEKEIEIHVGTGSICPTSSSYNQKKNGPAEEHVKLLIRVAKTTGAKVARCYMGTNQDRQGEGGIYRHIEETVKVLKAVKSFAADSGVKIAIENHAGDTQAWEMAQLIEAAGKDFVGCTMDNGNATWSFEDPMVNLEILGPYAISTGMRDSAVWETPKGASVMWVNMGDGTVDWQTYLKRYQELCPNCPFILEVLSYTWVRELPYLEEAFWKNYPKAKASEFARFLAFAKRGKEYKIPEARPAGNNSKELEQAQQKWDLEQSLKYCKEILGVGLK